MANVFILENLEKLAILLKLTFKLDKFCLLFSQGCLNIYDADGLRTSFDNNFLKRSLS